MSEAGQFLEDKPIELRSVQAYTNGKKHCGIVMLNWGGISFSISGTVQMLYANHKLPDAFHYFAPVEDNNETN